MEWRPVRGFEGYYEVSSTGIVYSMARTVPDTAHGHRTIRGRVMRQVPDKNGYLVVNLHKLGVSSVLPVHRLVADAFICNLFSLPVVNHIDGDKANNTVENLEWVSYSENNIHALQHQLRAPKSNPVMQMNMSGETIATYESVTDASRQTGISRGMISHATHGRAKGAGGFMWRLIGKCNDYPLWWSTAEDELRLEVQEHLIDEDIVCSCGNA